MAGTINGILQDMSNSVNLDEAREYLLKLTPQAGDILRKYFTSGAPMSNELYWAQQDKDGAFLNGKPIQVSTTNDLNETVLVCDWGWVLKQRLDVVRWLGNIATHVRQIKCMGSAVADLASLARGRIDIYLHSGLKPWDVQHLLC